MTPRLPLLSSAQVIQALTRAGFENAPKRGKGSHVAVIRFEPTGRKSLVIVPQRKELPRGTLAAVLEQAGLTLEEFVDLLQLRMLAGGWLFRAEELLTKGARSMASNTATAPPSSSVPCGAYPERGSGSAMNESLTNCIVCTNPRGRLQ